MDAPWPSMDDLCHCRCMHCFRPFSEEASSLAGFWLDDTTYVCDACMRTHPEPDLPDAPAR